MDYFMYVNYTLIKKTLRGGGQEKRVRRREGRKEGGMK